MIQFAYSVGRKLSPAENESMHCRCLSSGAAPVIPAVAIRHAASCEA